MKLDIIVDLQYGDCGKGKVSHHLVRTKKYTHTLRYNGGANAGHTIVHKGKEFITHQIPAGVFFGIPSIIGSGCVVDPDSLQEEIAHLKKGGVNPAKLLHIAHNAHVVQQKHKDEDGGDKKIGTTKRGIGPTYRDKYGRTGVRVAQVPTLKSYAIDLFELFHKSNKNAIVLAEGAQGFGLDIDWGDYPYVTSSHCTVGGALLNGFPATAVRDVWGVAKAYETYVGAKEFQPKDEIFNTLRELGHEYGATTGRARQCNWLNMDLLEKAVRMNGVTHLVINKNDILDQLGVWKIIDGKKTVAFKNKKDFRTFITKRLMGKGSTVKKIYFSERPDRI